MDRYASLVEAVEGRKPATVHKVQPFPWPYSSGYPPFIYCGGAAYLDTGDYTDGEPRTRIYLRAPDVTLAE